MNLTEFIKTLAQYVSEFLAKKFTGKIIITMNLRSRAPRGRVDWNKGTAKMIQVDEVAPRVNAWIETISPPTKN